MNSLAQNLLTLGTELLEAIARLVRRGKQFQYGNQRSFRPMQNLNMAFAHFFQIFVGDGDRFQESGCRRRGTWATRARSLANAHIRIDELDDFRRQLNEIDSFIEPSFVRIGQLIGDGVAPRLNEAMMKIGPKGGIFEIDIYTWKWAGH